MTLTPLVFLASALLDTQGPDSVKARAVACVQSSWNAYDARAARACFTSEAVALRNGIRVPIDWRAGEGYRSFDAAARSRFRFSVVAMDSTGVEATFVEHNDFLAALGIDSVRARWRYVVNGAGVITEEQHLEADRPFQTVFRRFVTWGHRTKPALWPSVLDGAGNVTFNGDTGPHLITLARLWTASGDPQ